MHRNWKHKKKTTRFLTINIFIMTFFLPASIIFITDLSGPDIGKAWESSYALFFDSQSAPVLWGFLLLLNLALFLYLKPILLFSKNCRQMRQHNNINRMKAAKRFNLLPNFIIFLSISGFLIFFLLEVSIREIEEFKLVFPIIYGIVEALTTGLFAGTIIYLMVENMLFHSKKLVFAEECAGDQKYSSFYMKLLLVVIAIVLFLLFQIFDSFSSFYIVGAGGVVDGPKNVLEGINRNFMESGDFFDMSRKHQELKNVLDVLVLRIFIFCLYAMALLWQIRKMIINPLETVQLKLENLNSDEPQINKQIDIINNDEFTGIYEEINNLIVKQNLQLQRSEEKLEKIVENAADPIISFHNDGTIHVFNPAAESFFGYSEEEAGTLKMIDLIDLPVEIKEVCTENQQIFIDYISNFDAKLKRFTGIHKSGEKINFESNVSKSLSNHGPLFTAILRDITGQIEFEETLKKAKTAAENANRMKSEFLANMSHELRTPLNAVLGFTQLLSTDKNLTQGQLEKIHTISRSGEHLLALINDILDISKIESGKTELHNSVFDLDMFINDLKDMFILKCQTKGLSFYVEFAGEIPPYVEGDLGKLRQIMINIIGNAVKFTNEGGISLLVGEENGNIRFSINDTGKGIPPEDIEKILQPFMQSSNVDHEGGTGLGLAITNSFIELMGGRLDIKSHQGTGSTFSFEVPLKISQTAPIEEKSRGTVISIKDFKPVKALIVDDKVNNRLILKTMLENVGFITMEAENGLQAVERTGEFDPYIIFMDIKMPVMDGYESVKKIKAAPRGKNIKVFALTASAFRHDEKKIFDSGFDGFLPKPFKLESLFRIISDKAGVEFNYADETIAEDNNQLESIKLDYSVLAHKLSESELETLSDNILINDFAAIKVYADNISAREGLSDFTRLISYYADNFNDQRLEDILSEIRKINK